MKHTLCSFGELLWDMLPKGPCIGGAPANIAIHANDAGLDTGLVTALGDDLLGHEILEALARRKFPARFICVDRKHPTGTVDVSIDPDGAASYRINTDVAWDYIPATVEMLAFVCRCDAFCYGSLAQRSPVSRATLETLLKNTRRDCLRLFDINLRKPFPQDFIIKNSLRYATHLKLNDEELPHLAKVHGLSGESESLAIEMLFGKYSQLTTILLTRGPDGADILTRDESFRIPASDVPMLVDTVGAGDAFTSGFIISTLRGESMKKAATVGNEYAAKVCSVAGAWLP